MSKREDYVSFDKALRDLKLRSEELRKLVSEGEIRAFKDGDSMRFRPEDIEALASRQKGEQDLAFVDALEDDTGMVTEQLSDEDTLLADDEELTEQKPAPRAAAARTVRSSRTPSVSTASESHEPKWVTAMAILGAVVLLWGMMITYSISQGEDPAANFFTQLFAQQK